MSLDELHSPHESNLKFRGTDGMGIGADGKDRLLEMALEAGQLGFWDWNIVTGAVVFSDFWSRMLGMDPSEVEPHVSVWEGLMHPDDEAKTTELLNAHLEGKTEYYESEHRLKHKDGGWVWVLDRGRVIERDDQGRPLRAVGTHTDITRRKEAERLLDERDKQFRALINVVPDIVWSAGPDGQMTYANEQWFEFVGEDAKSVSVQESFLAAIHPEDLSSVRTVWLGSRESGNQFHSEMRLRSKDGDYRWFLVRGEPARNEADGIIQWFGIATDITERRAIEAERERLLAVAESANQSKDEFLAMLSHELRSPLNAIYGWTQILEKGGLDEERVSHAIEVIGRNVRLQKTLIEDLLDVSRIISGKMRLDSEVFPFERVVAAALDAIGPTAEKKSIFVRKEIEGGPFEIRGDRNRLAQVVNNLLTNAVKFTPEHGLVQVVLRKEGTQVVLEVRDSGEGIDPELLPYVFDLFRRPEFNQKRKFGGMGLGLTLVKHFVEIHKGLCEARSDGEGRGATFTVRLPLETQ